MSTDWTDEAAEQLEELIGDPLADAVRGTIRIVGRSAPARRPRYQECLLDVVAEAPGLDPAPVSTTGVFDRKRWPEVGTVVPARVSPTQRGAIEILWDDPAR